MMRNCVAATFAFTGALVPPAPADLVSYWPLDGDVRDEAPGGHHQDNGEVHGAEKFVPGFLGRSLDLDGSSHVRFDVSQDLKLMGDVSVALWFRVPADGDGSRWLFAGGEGPRFFLKRSSEPGNELVFGGGAFPIGGGVIFPNKWHHLLAVSENDKGTSLYLDGQLVAIGSEAELERSLMVMLGANPLATGNGWLGQIDDVGVFDRALSAFEAAAIVELADTRNWHYDLGQVNGLLEAWRRQSEIVIEGNTWTFVEDIGRDHGLRLGEFGSGMRDSKGPYIRSFTTSTINPAAGQAVTLKWEADRAEFVTLESKDLGLVAGKAAGSRTFHPHEVTTCILTAVNAHGTYSASLTLYAGVDLRELQLTEWMASPGGESPDLHGNKPDWIEIHNPGAMPLPVHHYYLTDAGDDLDQWPLPPVVLGPGEYRLVYASGKEGAGAENDPWHASFKLDADGEYLALTHKEADDSIRIIEEKRYPEQQRGLSYGRPHGSETWAYLRKPTPGAENPRGFYDDLTKPVAFSHRRGIHENAFLLELQASEGYSIRYTLDGSPPTSETGLVYEQPFPIDRTTVVRALAHHAGKAPSPIETHTFLFFEELASQTSRPDGFPDKWGDLAADYEMDPDVVSDNEARRQLKEGLSAMPVISLALPVTDLFGPEGIYTHSEQSGGAWERACSMEMIGKSGRSFQIDCGLRMHGGAGRRAQNLKHSFRVLFKKDYGPGRLKASVFPAIGTAKSFDTLVLRAGFNNTWHSRGGGPGAQYLRDEFIRRTQRDMGHPSAHGTFVHVLLNGLYWGVYNLVERPSAPFAASYLGGEKEDWDALNSGKPIDGTEEAWNKAFEAAESNVTTPEGFEQVKPWVDVTNLIDYLILNFYGGNRDWDDHNWYAARPRTAGEGFKFFSWDAERTLEALTVNRVSWSGGPKPTGLHGALMTSAEYRMHFADRILRHFIHGGALHPDQTVRRYRRLAEEIEPAIICESARWGDAASPEVPYTIEDWRLERDRLLQSYLPMRGAVVMRQFERKGLFPSLAPPHLEPESDGRGAKIRLENADGLVFYTTDGSDPRLPGGAQNSTARRADSAAVRLSPGEVLKARAFAGQSWSALSEWRAD